MAEPILKAEGLWKTFEAKPGLLGRRPPPRRPALADVSLSVMKGEIVGIVGESGSGKTTLARCLALLTRPDRGRVLLEGEELGRLDPGALRARRRRIQTIFQDPFASLNPRLRVGDALAEVLRVHRLVPRAGVRARVAELLSQVGLPEDAARRYPAEFSGGQRQRVSIARALAAEPAVLIADEPVSALDVSIRAQVINLLLDLQQRLSLTILFIGHDLLLVDRIAPRIAVMLGGQIVELLPPGVPLSAARHPYTKELLAAAPRLTRTPPVAAETASELTAEMPAVGCPYWARCPVRADPRCAGEYPPLREIAAGHWIAAFYDPAPSGAVPMPEALHHA